MEKPDLKDVYAIIVAAGSGSRFGSQLPKQFCIMAGKPVLMHTVSRFRQVLPDDNIITVLSPDMEKTWIEMCREYGFTPAKIAYGGETRWQSVKNALQMIPPEAGIIMVHDGARPLVSPELILRASILPSHTEAAVPTIPLTDSIRRLTGGGTSCHADRAGFVAVQTPQSFRAQLLRRAYALPYSPDMTDDASVAEAAGADITLIEGEPSNIKITNPGDITIAEAMFKAQC